jgi:hypothetical protein
MVTGGFGQQIAGGLVNKMSRSRLAVVLERAEVLRYIAQGKHLRYDGSCRSLVEMAEDLGIPRRTVMRHINSCPKTAALVAASRTHKRGGPRRRILTGADF